MIVEITGLPGNGKTLYAIKYVMDWAEREKRPVYYSGIEDLMLPWTEIDPLKWFECPPNSIVVIDECQRVFRHRTATKDVPEHVSRLETHRHDGLDIVLITQHPLLTDPAVRRLVGKHFHVVRKWGTQSATIHEWAGVKESCDKPNGRADSIKHHWVFDKKLYSVYKSAEVHTMKRSIPKRVFVMFLLPLVFVGMGYMAYQYFMGMRSKPSEKPSQQKTSVPSEQAAAASPANQQGKGREPYQDPVADAQKFVYDRTERVQGLAFTAPRYDEVTRPVTAPRPAACLYNKSKCNCYSQQATLMAVPDRLCREIVQRGYFIDFDDGSSRIAKKEPEATKPQQTVQQVQPNVVRSDAVPVAVTEDAEKKAPASTPSTLIPSRVVVVRKPA